MKIDRLLAMTILLLNREKVTARELADRFEVSIRTIYRDIDALSMAGIPVVASQGTGGGIALMPGYKVDRQFFTANELLSLMTTLGGVTSILGDAEILGAEEKIRNLSAREKSAEEGRAGPVSIDLTGWETVPGIKEKVAGLVKAIQGEHLVSFAYTNLNGEDLIRSVEPLKVAFEFANWYMLGWCRLRRDYRYFRISRMGRLQILEESFNRSDRLEKCGKWEWKVKDPTEIRLLFKDEVAIRSSGYYAEDRAVEKEDGWHLTVLWPLDEWVYRFILGQGAQVEVLAPDRVREEVRRRLKEAAEVYG